MEAQRKRPYHYHKKRLKQAEESFVIDGNTKTFEPPVYNPLLDKHLQLFFAKSDRVDLLKHNKLINRRYEVVETAKRPSESTRHRKSMSFDRSYSMAEGKSVGLRPNLKLGSIFLLATRRYTTDGTVRETNLFRARSSINTSKLKKIKFGASHLTKIPIELLNQLLGGRAQTHSWARMIVLHYFP